MLRLPKHLLRLVLVPHLARLKLPLKRLLLPRFKLPQPLLRLVLAPTHLPVLAPQRLLLSRFKLPQPLLHLCMALTDSPQHPLHLLLSPAHPLMLRLVLPVLAPQPPLQLELKLHQRLLRLCLGANASIHSSNVTSTMGAYGVSKKRPGCASFLASNSSSVSVGAKISST